MIDTLQQDGGNEALSVVTDTINNCTQIMTIYGNKFNLVDIVIDVENNNKLRKRGNIVGPRLK